MSSILKALQRVEQERQPGAAGTPRRTVRGDFVAQPGAAPLRRARPRRRRLPLWAVAGVIVLVAVFVWWRLPDSPAIESEPALAGEAVPTLPEAEPAHEQAARHVAPEPETAPHDTRRARASAAASGLPSPPTESLQPAATAAGAQRDLAAAPRAARQPEPVTAPRAARPPQPAEALAPAAEPVPAEVVARLPPLGTALDAPAPAPEASAPTDVARAAPAPTPAPTVARAAPEQTPAPTVPRAAPEPETPVSRAAPAPTPAVARPAPPPPRQTVARAAPPPPAPPAVRVERTRWHPTGERRRAWVEVEGFDGLRELGEGEAVGAVVVKEIRPSSVVFLHGAETLTRRVGD